MKIIFELLSYTCNPDVLLALPFIPAALLADRARSWDLEEMLSILIFAAHIFSCRQRRHHPMNASISSSTDFLRASEPVV